MYESLVSLTALGVILLGAFALGRPTLRGLAPDVDEPLEVAVWSLALGLLWGGLAIALLGLVGHLSVTLLRVASLAAAAAGFWQLALAAKRRKHIAAGVSLQRACHPSPSSREAAAVPSRCRRFAARIRAFLLAPWAYACGYMLPRLRRYGRTPQGADVIHGSCFSDVPKYRLKAVTTSLVLWLVASTGALLGALAPPTAGDALCYHLELPKRYLAAGALIDLPYHDNGTFPLLAEMWFLWGLALEGGVAAQLVHWALGVLFGLATVLLARPLIGREFAWLAGAVAGLVPGVTNQMTAPLNDAALAALATLSLTAWRRATSPGGSPRWYLLAGLTLGAALSIKYVAFVFVAAMAPLAVWQMVHKSHAANRNSLLLGAATLALGAVSVSGMWYVRAAWRRGNPVYPFAQSVFDGEAGPNVSRDCKTPLEWTPADVATAPWQATMRPESFGGRGHQLGPLFLMIVPGVLLLRPPRWLKELLVFSAVYGLLWFALRQNARFLYPIVPPLAVGAVWLWIQMRRAPKTPRRLAIAVCAMVLVAQAAWPLWRARLHAAVALGWESRHAYLSRVEPTYPVARFVEEQLAPEARILSQDHAAFYFPCEVVRESVYRRKTAYQRRLESPEALATRVRDAGFTHLLLARAEGPGIRYNRTLSKLADEALGAGDASLRAICTHVVRDTDGATRTYCLMELRYTRVGRERAQRRSRSTRSICSRVSITADGRARPVRRIRGTANVGYEPRPTNFSGSPGSGSRRSAPRR